MNTKVCTKCIEIKPATKEYFHSAKLGALGLASICKLCKSAINKIRSAKPEVKAAKKANELSAGHCKKWYQANKDKAYDRNRKWSKANKDKVAATQAEWVRANLDKVKASNIKWAKNNPENIRLAKHRRRSREKSCGGNISKGITLRLMADQSGVCNYCKIDITEKYHIDHIMPLALGGANDDDNVQLLCPNCNLRKSAKHPEIFMNEIGLIC